jgi:hypothetical protein
VVAGHLAAGMAIKGRVPDAPMLALLVGAVFLDVLNPVLAVAGVDRATVIGWSHSLTLSIAWSLICGAFFLFRGWTVSLAIAVAVFSHFLLDLIVHSELPLWPGSSFHLGLGRWTRLPDGWWLVELTVVAIGVLYYWVRCRKLRRFRPIAWALGGLVLGLHVLNSPWF